MKIAAAQFNPIVGDIAGNTARIAETISRAADRGAELVVFGELSVVGYPPRDLLRKALASDEASYAPGHPSIARSQSNLALVLQPLKKFKRFMHELRFETIPLKNFVELLNSRINKGGITLPHFQTKKLIVIHLP